MGPVAASMSSIGGVIILMLWLYFTGLILILGGAAPTMKEEPQQSHNTV